MNESPTSKRCWEVYAVCSILLVPLGLGIVGLFSGPGWVTLPVLAVAILFAGLVLRSALAWWTTFLVALLFTVVAGGSAWHDVQKFGLRWHRALWPTQAAFVLCAASVSFLLTAKIRGAYGPPRALPAGVTLSYRRVATVLAVPIFAGVILVSLTLPALMIGGRVSHERNQASTLKTLTSAEADFRGNDRDGNNVQDFWTGDVQGLYAIVPPRGKEPIKLIEYSLATADADPIRGLYPPMDSAGSPKGGAWFWALPEDRTESPPVAYRSPGRNHTPDRFGFITFPDDDVTGGRSSFIVNENNTIYRRHLKADLRPSDRTPPGPLTAPGFTAWPSEQELKSDWSKLD